MVTENEHETITAEPAPAQGKRVPALTNSQDLQRAREVAEISPVQLGEKLAKVEGQRNYVATEVLIQAVLGDSVDTAD